MKRSEQKCQDKQSQDSQSNPDVQGDVPNQLPGFNRPPSRFDRPPSNRCYTRNAPGNQSSSSSNVNSNSEGDSSDRKQTMFTREIISEESASTTTISSLRNACLPVEDRLLGRICNIFCCMIEAIICLPQTLSRVYNYVKDQVSMEKCWRTVKCASVVAIVTFAAIYIACHCKKYDGIVSKEQYETELKSLWQSQLLLEEQFSEIKVIQQETDRLRAEIKNLNEGILQSVKQVLGDSEIPGDDKSRVLALISLAFKKIYEDHIQMADWAQKTLGATIDEDRTSKTYDPEKAENCWLGWLYFSSARPPDTILQPDVYPGNCWAFEGSEGQVVVKLPEKIHTTAVTVQHISKVVSPSGEIGSALKDFSVFGINDGDKKEILLGTFMYDIKKEAIQTFTLQNEGSEPFRFIKFRVMTNWGNPNFTCIYRVRVHGNMVPQLSTMEEGKARQGSMEEAKNAYLPG